MGYSMDAINPVYVVCALNCLLGKGPIEEKEKKIGKIKITLPYTWYTYNDHRENCPFHNQTWAPDYFCE